MTDFFSIHTLLFAAKWAFVGLIYFILLIVVVAVRREMSLRLGSGKPLPSATVGWMRVLQTGTDPNVLLGSILPLTLENKLGALEDNDIILLDNFISGHHARLRWDGAGWWVEDLDSKNGTFVDDEPCVPLIPHPLSTGGKLRLGDMVFELVE